jgi:predicted phage terminase large subunit-like protein
MKKSTKKIPINNPIDAIAKDRVVRQTVARESHLMFFHLYFSHYVKYQIAEFQKDIFRITEDTSNKLACVVAFRGSAKSTIVTLSYSLWAILGIQQKKFVLIICQTQAQARQHMINIRRELENNKLLKSDMGPFQEETGGEWALSSLVFRNTNARITVASVEQSIRGMRHYEHRPEVLILDDVEDMNSCKTREGREKTFDWFTREVIPLGDIGTRTIIVGNLLHEDSLMMRLKTKIESKEVRGLFRWYPLVDDDGQCLWPGKFDTEEKIEDLRRSVANELAWQQEYLLRIVSDSTRVVFPEWIQYYNAIPKPIKDSNPLIATGVDLAVKDKETSDYTAMVTAEIHGYGKDMRIYILPNPINAHLTFPDILATIKTLHENFKLRTQYQKIYVEDVQAQNYVVQSLERDRVPVKGINPGGYDKRMRIAFTSEAIRSGIVLFPREGAEILISQLVGFGFEHHDDLADAFAMMINETIKTRPPRSLVRISGGGKMFTSGWMNKKF